MPSAVSSRSKFARRLKDTVIVLGVCTLMLLALESGIRLAYPAIRPLGTDHRLIAGNVYGVSAGLKPLAAGRSGGAFFRVDGQGFWSYSATPEHPAFSWLFLGDSVTMGMGVDPDSTFAGRMAGRLDSLRVLNPSLIGYSSQDYVRVLATLLEHGMDERPIRRATIFWCLNDAHRDLRTVEPPGANASAIGRSVMAVIRKHVMIYQWLKATLLDRSRVYYEHDRRLYADTSHALAGVLADIRQVAGLCRSNGIRCEIVLLPYEYQLRQGVFEPQQTLAERLQAVPLPIFDPSHYLLEHSNTPAELFLYGDGIHFSARGHRVLAQYLLEHMAPL